MAGQKSLSGGFNDIKTAVGKPTDSAAANQKSLRGAFNDMVDPVNGLPKLVAAFTPLDPIPSPIPFPPTTVMAALETIREQANMSPYPGPATINLVLDGLEYQLCLGPGTSGPTASVYQATKYLLDNVGTPSDTFPAQETLFAAVNGIGDGVGNPTDTFPAQETLFAAVNGISGGIGSATTPNTLLAGLGTPTDSATAGKATLYGGLNDINAGIGSATTNPSLLYATNAIYGGLSQIKGAASTGSTANPGLLEGLEQLGSGLNTAVAGLGSPSTSNTLIWGESQIVSGLDQLKAGLELAYTGVTGQMQPAIGDSLKQLDVTMGQLEAIKLRGKKFDTFMGRVENRGSTSDMRFLLQTKPVQNPNQSNGWLFALVISLLGAAALVVFGLFAFKKYA
jgi:hypothetical protein